MKPMPGLLLAAGGFALVALALAALLWRDYDTVPSTFLILAVALDLAAAGGARLVGREHRSMAAGAPLLGILFILMLGILLRLTGLTASFPVEPITLAFLLAVCTPLWVGSALLATKARTPA